LPPTSTISGLETECSGFGASITYSLRLKHRTQTGHMQRKCCEAWTCVFYLRYASVQTDRHLIAILRIAIAGEVKNSTAPISPTMQWRLPAETSRAYVAVKLRFQLVSSKRIRLRSRPTKPPDPRRRSDRPKHDQSRLDRHHSRTIDLLVTSMVELRVAEIRQHASGFALVTASIRLQDSATGHCKTPFTTQPFIPSGSINE